MLIKKILKSEKTVMMNNYFNYNNAVLRYPVVIDAYRFLQNVIIYGRAHNVTKGVDVITEKFKTSDLIFPGCVKNGISKKGKLNIFKYIKVFIN